MISSLCDDFLSRNFTALVIAARHVNVGTPFRQIENRLTANACVTACHDHYLSIDTYVAVKLAPLNPLPKVRKRNKKPQIANETTLKKKEDNRKLQYQ